MAPPAASISSITSSSSRPLTLHRREPTPALAPPPRRPPAERGRISPGATPRVIRRATAAPGRRPPGRPRSVAAREALLQREKKPGLSWQHPNRLQAGRLTTSGAARPLGSPQLGLRLSLAHNPPCASPQLTVTTRRGRGKTRQRRSARSGNQPAARPPEVDPSSEVGW